MRASYLPGYEHGWWRCWTSNGDGNVNSTDLTMLKRYLLKSVTNINREAADVNRDGAINSSDMTILRDI